MMMVLLLTISAVESFDKLPNGNGNYHDITASGRCESYSSLTDHQSYSLNCIVDRYFGYLGTIETNGYSDISYIKNKYGAIEDWDVSEVTNMQYLLSGNTLRTEINRDPSSQFFVDINPDISKWDVSRVRVFHSSTFFYGFS